MQYRFSFLNQLIEPLHAAGYQCQRRSIHRPDDDLVEGGTLSWIDCGLLGNWIAEGDEDITEMESGGPTGLLTLRSVEASEIQETLLSYLPLAFTSDEGDPTAEEGQNALPA